MKPSDSERKVQQLGELLKGRSCMLIVMQDYPDPDAIASAAGLRELANTLAGVPCFMAHGGHVGRSENRALVRYLDLNLHALASLDMGRFDTVALVDTQPGTGNNSLPPESVPDIVIDHHPIRRATRRSPFTDVRSRYGAASTILHEYLLAAGIEIGTPTATALLYGIRSDTQDLGREARRADTAAFLSLYPLANKPALSRIMWGREPPEYFVVLAEALARTRLYGSCVVTGLGSVDNPDMIGEVADLLTRHRDAEWVLCYGFCGNQAMLSVRTTDASGDAGAVARRLAGRKGTGGGHRAMGGGQIPLAGETGVERRRVERAVTGRFLRILDAAERQPRKLVP